MTNEEHDMVKGVHDWLFKPPLEGRPTRAQQLDDVMAAIRAGKMSARVILYIAGAVSLIITAYASLKGIGK